MRVFISSVIKDFEQFRKAAASAIQSLGHEVIRAEDFAASPSSAQVACLAGLRLADAVIVLFGARYGEVQASGLSATHEEFNEARRTKQVFAFVQTGITPEVPQAALIAEAQSWATGHFTGQFRDEETLRTLVTRALHRWELGIAAGDVDPEDMAARATQGLPEEDRGYRSSGAALAISIVGAPRQPILRPSELEAAGLSRRLAQQALFGDFVIFDSHEGTDSGVEGHTLTLTQEARRMRLTEEGSLLLVLALPKSEGHFSPIIEEDVTSTMVNALQFAAEVLQSVDPTERLSSIAVAVSLLNSNHASWRTRAEHERSPDRMTMSRMFDESGVRVVLSPPHRSRAAFRNEAQKMAEDFMVLLRRPFRA
jgi:hypothetical protein